MAKQTTTRPSEQRIQTKFRVLVDVSHQCSKCKYIFDRYIYTYINIILLFQQVNSYKLSFYQCKGTYGCPLWHIRPRHMAHMATSYGAYVHAIWYIWPRHMAHMFMFPSLKFLIRAFDGSYQRHSYELMSTIRKMP